MQIEITYYLLSTLDFDQLVTFFVYNQFAFQTFVTLTEDKIIMNTYSMFSDAGTVNLLYQFQGPAVQSTIELTRVKCELNSRLITDQ